MINKTKVTHYFVIWTFILLYLFTSIISAIHVVSFFDMANVTAMAVALAVAFELGAAASLASIIVLDKMNKWIVWSLFIVLTAMQAMGNAYNAYINLENFRGWIELFGLTDQPEIAQKRILAIISGAIIPIVALGFIKALVDYVKPTKEPEHVIDAVIDDGGIAPESPVTKQLLNDVLHSSPVTSPNNIDLSELLPEPEPDSIPEPESIFEPESPEQTIDALLDELAAPTPILATDSTSKRELEHKYADVRTQ